MIVRKIVKSYDYTIIKEVKVKTPVVHNGTEVIGDNGERLLDWDSRVKADKTALEAETKARMDADTNTLAEANKHADGAVGAVEKKIPTNNNQLTNGAGFITRLVADLENYYKKSETYTRDEIDNKIALIPKFKIEPVEKLPTENISETTVYLVKSGAESGNLYTEYIYVNGAWEKLGEQKLDLSGYAKTEYVDKQIGTLQEELTKIDGIVAENNADIGSIKKELPNKFDKANIKGVHDNSENTVYNTKQVNSEIIDAFKYNFEQLVQPLFTRNGTYQGVTYTGQNDSVMLSGTAIKTGGVFVVDRIPYNFIIGHKYFTTLNSKIRHQQNLVLHSSTTGSKWKAIDNDICFFNIDIEHHAFNYYLNFVQGENYDNIYIKPILIDLTDMFGAGNEPSTVEELYQYIVKDKYYPYGRNIEPRMYCTKADANKLSMCPSDTVDSNIMPNIKLQENNEFTAPSNGQFFLLWDSGAKNISVNVLINNIPYDYVTAIRCITNTIRVPLCKGDNIRISIVSYADLNQATTKFIHSKELEL